jgi:hypothetical protein
MDANAQVPVADLDRPVPESRQPSRQRHGHERGQTDRDKDGQHRGHREQAHRRGDSILSHLQPARHILLGPALEIL